MSAHGDPNKSVNEDITFEPTDVATRPIVISVVLLAVFTIVFTFAAHLTYFGFAEREKKLSPEPSPLAEQYAAKEPPAPRLQIHPKTDLDVLRAAEDKVLGRLAWVDKDKGLVQVPIERAMEMLLAKGLPAREGSVPWKMAPQGVAPAQAPEAAGAPDWYGEGGAGHAQDSTHGADGSGAPAHGKPAEGHGH
jgi:hypothetical protein